MDLTLKLYHFCFGTKYSFLGASGSFFSFPRKTKQWIGSESFLATFFFNKIVPPLKGWFLDASQNPKSVNHVSWGVIWKFFWNSTGDLNFQVHCLNIMLSGCLSTLSLVWIPKIWAVISILLYQHYPASFNEKGTKRWKVLSSFHINSGHLLKLWDTAQYVRLQLLFPEWPHPVVSSECAQKTDTPFKCDVIASKFPELHLTLTLASRKLWQWFLPSLVLFAPQTDT